MSKTTIVIDGSPLASESPSGVGRSLIELLRALDASQSVQDAYNFKVVVPSRKKHFAQLHVGELSSMELANNYVQNRILNVLNYYRVLLPMDWFYGRGIYFFPNFKNWPLARSKSVTMIHDIAFKLFPETVEAKNRAMLDRYVDHWITRTDVLVTVSNVAEQEINAAFPSAHDKTTVLPNIVDQARFHPQNPDVIADFKQRLKIPENYLLFVSTIEPRKNLATLLDAVMLLDERTRRKYPLAIAGGNGWAQEAVITRVDEMAKRGEVIRLGYIDDRDKPLLYASATLMVHPAIHEGFGMTPLEAYACATPTLVNDIPVLREVMGDDAIYADCTDPQKLADAIKQYVSAPRPEKSAIDQRLKPYQPDAAAEVFKCIMDTQL